MSENPTLQLVLDHLEAARSHLLALPGELSDAERQRIGTLADWSARDALPHVTFWNRHLCHVLDCAASGGIPQRYEDFNAENDRVQQETCRMPWETALAEASAAYDEVIRRVQALGMERLGAPPQHDWQRGRTLLAEVIDTAVWHAEWHLADYHVKHGSPERGVGRYEAMSEKLMSWADWWQVDGAYNLACVYAQAGLFEKALPRLEAAFQARPALREWAQKDNDLAPLRGHPGFEALVKA